MLTLFKHKSNVHLLGNSINIFEIVGAIMVAPMINPYEKSMTREELRRTWENWGPRKRLLYFLARRFPRFLSYFYRRSFLSGRHEEIEGQLSLSLRKKVSSWTIEKSSMISLLDKHTLHLKFN